MVIVVIDHGLGLNGIAGDFQRDMDICPGIAGSGALGKHGYFQGGQGPSGVAIAYFQPIIHRRGIHRELEGSQPAHRIRYGALEQIADIFRSQRFKLKYLAARYQRSVNGEKRILRGGTDEGDDAVFHIRQKYVLLRSVKAVNFIEEKNCALARAFQLCFGLRQYIAHVFNAGGGGIDAYKVPARGSGNEFRQRRFPGSGRTVKNQTHQPVGFNHAAQKLAR